MARHSAVASIIVTVVVIGLLMMSGPVSAVNVSVTRDKQFYNALDNVKFTVSVDVETGERIPVQNLTLKIYREGVQVRNCTFNPQGSKISVCENILNITVISAAGYANATGLYGYGFGAGQSGTGIANQTFFPAGYGYGYGYGFGYSGELSYNITWNVSAESTTDGNYTADLLAYAADNLGSYRVYSDATPISGDNAFTVDKTKPNSAAIAFPFDNSGNITVSYVNASDNIGLSYVSLWYNNGSGWTNTGLTKSLSSDTFSFAPGSNGNYSFCTRAVDIAGNIEDLCSTADTYTIYDTSAPASRALSTLYTNNGNISVSFTSSDSLSGVKNVSLYFNKNGAGYLFTNFSLNPSGTFAFDATGEANYSFHTRAADNAGNIESKSGADNLTIYDISRPQSMGVSQEFDFAGNITVNFTASDTGGSGLRNITLQYSLNKGSSWLGSGLVKTGIANQFSFSPPNLTANYTFRTIAADRAGNVEAAPVSWDSYTYYDAESPVVTAKTSPSATVTTTSTTLTVATNEFAVCKYSGSAGVAYLNMSNSTLTVFASSHSWTVLGLSDGVKPYYVRCRDVFNHTSTTDFDASFTVELPQQVRSSGGGGISTVSRTASHSWQVLQKGSSKVLKVSNSNIAITSVQFVARSASTNARLQVSSFAEKPSEIPAPATNVLEYFEIEASDIDVESAKVSFRVPLSWLKTNQDVALFRWSGSWQELPTILVQQDVNYAYFEATTPGFSYFAIVAKDVKQVVTVQPVTEPISTKVIETTTITAPLPDKERRVQITVERSITAIIISMVILTLALFIASFELFTKRVMPRLEKNARNYVERSRAMGKTDQVIRDGLRKSSWPEKKIDKLMKK